MHRPTTKAIAPSIQIEERDGKVVKLNVTHAGRISSILSRFPDAVVRQAINQMEWWVTRQEGQVLKLSRRLDPIAQSIVQDHLLLPRCEKIAAALQSKSVRHYVPSRHRTLTDTWSKLQRLLPVEPTRSDERCHSR